MRRELRNKFRNGDRVKTNEKYEKLFNMSGLCDIHYKAIVINVCTDTDYIEIKRDPQSCSEMVNPYYLEHDKDFDNKSVVKVEIICEECDVEDVKKELKEWFFSNTSIGMDDIKIEVE